jgi:hypothetical protein
MPKSGSQVSKSAKVNPLNLEIEAIEMFCQPGCGTSTTSHLCTCPVSATTTSSLFTSKTTT